jgi:hypothetical protein
MANIEKISIALPSGMIVERVIHSARDLKNALK